MRKYKYEQIFLSSELVAWPTIHGNLQAGPESAWWAGHDKAELDYRSIFFAPA